MAALGRGATVCPPVSAAEATLEGLAAARLTPRPTLDNAALLRLAPLLVGRARRGVLGSSRYARALREAVREASCDANARPVLISGEPGLEKDNLAALIHFGSPARQQLMVRLDGALLRPDGGELFGGNGDGPPLLELLGDGALLIDKLDQVPPSLLPRLLQLARDGHWQAHGGGEARRFGGRLFLTSEAAVPQFDRCCTLIRVPPLRVRRQDLGNGCVTACANAAASWAGPARRWCRRRW